MKFLCLVYFRPDAFAGLSAEEMTRVDDATIEHDHKLRAGGNLLIASPLQGLETQVVIDRRVRLKKDVIDGPFAESKEVLGGFQLVEASDMASVVALFDDDPISDYARLEIRPLMEDHRHSQTGQARPEFVAG